jgi:DNA-directed RNA polymerase subunit D
MIKILNYDKKEQRLGFTVEMSTSLANAIRRSALEIPIMAIDEVEIVKNDSALYDEIIAHRLGSIPIKTDKTSKEIKFKLKANGPKTVYSTDIQPSVGTNYQLPITLLDEGQEMELVAEARLGKGIEHVKYSPGLIYYKHNLDEDILDYVKVDDKGKLVFDEEELKEKGISEEKLKKIKKAGEVKELVFNIEAWGQLEVKNIFLKAIEVLDENLQELNKAIK